MVIDGKTYTIPADTRCTISLDGIGSQPGCWGSDASKFLPTRWLLDASEVEKDSSAEAPKSTSTTGIAATPNLRQPAKGAFLPWSGGPRQCPGMKMAQVEFMAVVYSVFRQHRVEAVQKPGESAFDARRRLRDVTNDSHPHVTLQMNHPRDVVLKWVKR